MELSYFLTGGILVAFLALAYYRLTRKRKDPPNDAPKYTPTPDSNTHER